jgi:DinB superfamily
MNHESIRIADQLRRAYIGDAWHGPPLRELLAGVSAAQAHRRPLLSAHTIGELVLHIDLYVQIAFDATRGNPMPKLYVTQTDWPALPDGEAAWTEATNRLFANAESLAHAIEGFADDARLKDIVPGREYDFYYLFHGIVQHSLYHGGQIALLKSR